MKAEKFANLVNKAKNNSEAVMEILKIMKPIINKYVKKIYFMDKEDAEQELNLAIIEAIQRISNCKYDGQCIVYIENAIKFKYAHLCKSNIRREEAEGKYVEELKAKTAAELNEELVAAKKELFNLRFQNATNQLDNTARIKEVRKNIARIQTIITKKAREVK